MAENNVDLLEMFGPPDNGTVVKNEDTGQEAVVNVTTSTPDQVDLGSLFGEPDAAPEMGDPSIPELWAMPNYGRRKDGTPKGTGFLGVLQRPDGRVSTELSIDVEMDGETREIPTLVPTLTKPEIDYLLGGGKPTPEIVDKAVKHAQKRISEGKSVYAETQIPISNQAVFDKQMELFTNDLMLGVYGEQGLKDMAESQKKINFFMSRAPRIALAFASPLAAVAYEVLDQGKSVLVSQLKGEDYDPLERRILTELLPDKTPTAIKVASALGETLVDIALVGGAMNAAKEGTLNSAVKDIVQKIQRQGIDISKGRIPTKAEIAQAARGTSLEKAIKVWWKAKKLDISKLMRKQIEGGPKIEGPVGGTVEVIKPLPAEIGDRIVRDAAGNAITMGLEAVDKTVPTMDPFSMAIEEVSASGEVSKAGIILSPQEEKEYLTQIRDEISYGEPGYRMPVEDGVWMGVGSTYPDYFQNKGYTKKFALNAIDKYLSGAKLGPKQEAFIEDMKEVAIKKEEEFRTRDAEDKALEAENAKMDAEERAAMQTEEGDASFEFGANAPVEGEPEVKGTAPKPKSKYTRPGPLTLITAQNRLSDLMGIKKFVEPLERAKMGYDHERWTIQNDIKTVMANLKKIKTMTPRDMAILLNTNVEAPIGLGEKEKAVFDYFRGLTREMLARTNEVRERMGVEPIKDIGAYFRHMAKTTASEITAGRMEMPEKMKGWADKNIPKEIKNPMEIERKITDELLTRFNDDLETVMMAMVNTALKEIYFAEALEQYHSMLAGAQIDKKLMEKMTPEEKVAYLAMDEMPKEVKDWMEEYVKIVLLDEKQTKMDQYLNQALKEGPVADFFNNQLARWGKHLSDRAFTNLLSNISKMPLYGVIGGVRPKLLLRNKMQLIQNTALYGVWNAIKGTFPTSDYPVLEKIKAESLFYNTYSGIEAIPPDLRGKISKAMMASFQWTAITNVSQAMNAAYHWTAEQIQDPKMKGLGWADPKRTYTEDPNFFYPSEMELLRKEMEYGAQTTQYQYLGLSMPQIFRYKGLSPATRLQSWWMNHWGIFLREAATRAIRGHVGYTIEVTYEGAGPDGEDVKAEVQPKISAKSRKNFWKYLVLGGVVLNTLGYGKSFVLGTVPTAMPPTMQLALSAIKYFTTDDSTPYGRNEKRVALEQMKTAAKTFIPSYLTYNDIKKWATGESRWQQMFFYNKDKGSSSSSGI